MFLVIFVYVHFSLSAPQHVNTKFNCTKMYIFLICTFVELNKDLLRSSSYFHIPTQNCLDGIDQTNMIFNDRLSAALTNATVKINLPNKK